MVKATFEYIDNQGIVTLLTHFGHCVDIKCQKNDGEIFRLGGTAINNVICYEGVILNLMPIHIPFRAFYNENSFFESVGVLSSEKWNKSDLHCYVTEYYPLNMEDKKHEWFISKKPIKDANHLFVNLDILDGGNNIIKRYRISPFTGQHVII